MNKPLKNKLMKFEQDYIETDIKWGLKLGDDIFKKVDVARAVKWAKFKAEQDSVDKKISLSKLNNILNESFYDSIKRKKIDMESTPKTRGETRGETSEKPSEKTTQETTQKTTHKCPQKCPQK